MDLIAVNALFLSQSTETNIKGYALESRIDMTAAPSQNLGSGDGTSQFVPRHLATLEKTTNVLVSHSLVFEQATQRRVSVLDVVSWIFFVQETLNVPRFPSLTQSLGIADVAHASVAKGTYSELTLTQSVTLSMTRNFPVTQTLAMVSQVTGYLPDYYWQSYPIPDF